MASAVRRATVEVLDAIGLRDGPSDTEFRLPGGVPRLIETHNRVGGNRIHDLVEATCGVDQDRQWLGARPRTVAAVEGLDDVRRHPGVLAVDLTVQAGDRVRPVRTSWERLGQLVVAAPTTGAAVALAETLAAKVQVVTR